MVSRNRLEHSDAQGLGKFNMGLETSHAISEAVAGRQLEPEAQEVAPRKDSRRKRRSEEQPEKTAQRVKKKFSGGQAASKR